MSDAVWFSISEIFTHFLFDWKLVWAGLIQRFQETVPLKIWEFRFRISMLSVLKFFWLMKYPCHRSPVYATYFFISKRYFFMIGYCCDDDKKLLVAEYMHHDTLAKHLFNWENQTIEWAMRL